MALPPKHLPLQRAVAYLLTYKPLRDILCTADRLVPLLNVFSGCEFDGSIAKVDAALIKKAFKSAAAVEYLSPYKKSDQEIINLDIKVSTSGNGSNHHLFVRADRNICEIGRLTSTFGRPRSYPVVGTNNNQQHPLSTEPTLSRQKDVEVVQWLHNNISSTSGYGSGIRDELVTYLKDLQSKRNREAARYKKKTEDKKVKEEKQAAKLSILHDNDKNKKREALQTPPDGAVNSNNNTPSSKSSPKRGGDKKKRKHTLTKDEITLRDLKDKFTTQETSIKQGMESLNTMNGQIKHLEQKIKNDNDDKENGDDMEIDTPTFTSPVDNVDEKIIDKSIPIQFIVNGGHVGSIDLSKDTLLGGSDSGGIIQLKELVRGLEKLPKKLNTDKAAKTRKRKKWGISVNGSSQVCHPNGTEVISTKTCNYYLKCAAIVRKLLWLFSGKQHRFSREAMMIFTLGGIHNYGGSDEAFQIMMSQIFKGLLYDIGVPLSSLMLARGTPSRRTIARYEHWFAADCLMMILYEIKSDGAIEVSLICDHGHRAGQDHFVIVICWAAIDGTTKRRVYKHFCPSIDSSGHKSAEAADAIKLVLSRLLLDEGITATVEESSDQFAEMREAEGSMSNAAEEPMDVDLNKDASASTASTQPVAATLTQASATSSNEPTARPVAENGGEDNNAESIRGGSNVEDTLGVQPTQPPSQPSSQSTQRMTRSRRNAARQAPPQHLPRVQEEPSSQAPSQPSSQSSQPSSHAASSRSRGRAARRDSQPRSMQVSSSDVMSSHEDETTMPTLPQHVQNEISEAVSEVAKYRARLTSATSDSGGGAAIQNLEPKLKANGILTEEGNTANCVNHALQKALQNACEGTQGKQGLGKRDPGQLIYTVSKMFSTIKKIGHGVEFLDHIFAMVKHEMAENGNWARHAEKFMELANEEYLSALEEIANASPEEIVDLTEMYYKSPRGVEEPVWTRWQTIIKVTAIVLDNWASIYFLAVTIKTKETSEKYLCKVACTVISLMNERSVANVDSSIDFDQAIESANVESTDASFDNVYDERSREAPPTFYVMLLWNRAFCDHAFNLNWRVILQDDPYFGSFGQCSRLMAERAILIYNQAAELKGTLDDTEEYQDESGLLVPNPTFGKYIGGWKTNPLFKKYRTAVSRMPRNVKGDNIVNRKFFEETLPKEFLDVYLESIKKGITKRWWSDDLIYYLLGGDPVLAKEFARMLMHYKDEVAMEEANPGYIIRSYPYTNMIKTTTLGAHHTMFDDKIDPIKLDVKTTLQQMTIGTDWSKVVNKPFVVDYGDEIEKLASADGVVDMFQLKNGAELDKSTWEDKDFTKLLDAIHRSIGIHAHHQQRIENMVQMAALLAKTSVGEIRRTWRAIILSAVIRPCNLWMIAEAQAREKDPEKRKKITRVSEGLRVELLSDYYDNKIKPIIDEARKNISHEEYMRIHKSISTTLNKASEVEQKAYLAEIEKALKNANNLKQLAAEKVSGYEATARVKGKVDLVDLKQKDGFEPHIEAELIARDIFTSERFLTKHKALLDQLGEEEIFNNKKGGLGFKEKKRLLKENEAEREQRKNSSLPHQEALDITNSIKPFSAMMKLILLPDEDEATNE